MRNCTNSSNCMLRKRCWKSKRYKRSARKAWLLSRPFTSQRSFLEVGWTTKTIKRDTSQSASSQLSKNLQLRNTTSLGIRSSPPRMWSTTFTRMSKLMRSSQALLKMWKGCLPLIWTWTNFTRCPLKRKRGWVLKIGRRRKQKHSRAWSG